MLGNAVRAHVCTMVYVQWLRSGPSWAGRMLRLGGAPKRTERRIRRRLWRSTPNRPRTNSWRPGRWRTRRTTTCGPRRHVLVHPSTARQRRRQWVFLFLFLSLDFVTKNRNLSPIAFAWPPHGASRSFTLSLDDSPHPPAIQSLALNTVPSHASLD